MQGTVWEVVDFTKSRNGRTGNSEVYLPYLCLSFHLHLALLGLFSSFNKLYGASSVLGLEQRSIIC